MDNNAIFIVVVTIWILSLTILFSTSQNSDKLDYIVETLKCPINQLEISKQNMSAFKAMENDPLPEYK